MKDAIGIAVGILVVLVFMIGLGWLFAGNDLAMYGYFAPRQEAIRRHVFETSKAYNQGMIQNLRSMQLEYLQADSEHKKAIGDVILHQYADYDDASLPSDLRIFMGQLKSNTGIVGVQ